MIEKILKWIMSIISSVIVLLIVKNAQKIVWKIKCWWKGLKKKPKEDENTIIEKAMQSLEENMAYNKRLQEKARELDERERRIEEIEKRLFASEEAVEI